MKIQAVTFGAGAISSGAVQSNKGTKNNQRQVNFTSGSIAKTTANTHLNNFLGHQSVNGAKSVSFKGEKDKHDASDEFPENNREVLLPVYEDVIVPTMVYGGTQYFQTGTHTESRHTGYMYIDENGHSKRFSSISALDKEIVDRMLSPEKIESTIKGGLIDSSQFTKFLIERDRLDEAIVKYNSEEYKEFYKKNSYDFSKSYIAEALVADGRFDEANKLDSRTASSKAYELGIRPENKAIENTKGVKDSIADGNLEGILELSSNGLPYSIGHSKKEDIKIAIDFINKNLDIEEWAQFKRKRAKSEAKGGLYDDSAAKRIAKGVLTVGISEIINAAEKRSNKNYRLSQANEEISKQRNLVNEILLFVLQLKEEQIETSHKKALKLKALEEKKEGVKSALKEGLLNPIKLDRSSRPAKFPNCVMFVGENPYAVKELINWTGEHADANYVIVPHNLDNGALQKDLFAELKEAEENYQKTGKRSVIFVEGMGKLLNPKSNSSANIAIMKNLMNIANKNFHSTILFHTKDPSKLDPGTTVSHRVGLKVNVPISFDDANLLKV